MEIGSKIKRLRMQHNLTQEELANRTELSKGFISQIERDLTSPSIATLVDILECLGTDLKNFFNETEQEKIVFTTNDIFIQENDELRNKIHWVIPNAQKNDMEPILIELGTGGKSVKEDPHEGEEFGYIISGTIIVHIGNNKYKAKKGDYFYYRPTSRHFLENVGKNIAKILWVVTPPTF